MSTDHHAGLEEVKVLSSRITLIKGKDLFYRGISISELAQNAVFEEVVYLLWYGRLPAKLEYDRFIKEWQENNSIPLEIKESINQMPRQAHPITALRTLVSALALYDQEPDSISIESSLRKGMRILSKLSTLVAGIERHRRSKSVIDPLNNLNFAENILFQINSYELEEVYTKALNMSLILYAEHELNASTFVARTVAASESDLHSAITSALATLKGDLSGGANRGVMKMLLDIGDPEKAENWIDKNLKDEKKIMGFGHQVYKKGDPRAIILKSISEEVCVRAGTKRLYEIADKIEGLMKQKKGLEPNIDFYSGLVFYALGFPVDTFQSIFAVARVAGWIAHYIEQLEDNRLIQPRAEYIGVKNQKFIPLDSR